MPDKNERPSTYVVQDRKSEDELSRLKIQDKMATIAMGGVLPEQPDPTVFKRVLDVGCGSGGWVIEAAQTYPTMSLIGIDISNRMIDHARSQANELQLSDRVEFHTMDALLMLEFPTDFFDLVNLRFGISFLRTWDWPKILQEMQRVTRADGVIRVTEGEIAPQATASPAVHSLYEMLICAFFRAGHLFEQEPTGLTGHLVDLLTRYGCQKVQTEIHALEFLAETPQGQATIDDTKLIFRTVRPFIEKWGCGAHEYDTLYQQAIEEMQRPDFRMNSNGYTVWGLSPQKRAKQKSQPGLGSIK